MITVDIIVKDGDKLKVGDVNLDFILTHPLIKDNLFWLLLGVSCFCLSFSNFVEAKSAQWKEIKGKQILGYDFDRQRPIDNYIVDFYCKDLQLAIEIDGNSHNDKFEEDSIRQKRIESFGVTFLRFDDLEVKKDMNYENISISEVWLYV